MKYLGVPQKYESEVERLIPYVIADKVHHNGRVVFACETYNGRKWRAFVRHIETTIEVMEALYGD